MIAKRRTMCTFFAQVLEAQLVKSSVWCVQNPGLYLMGAVVKSWHFHGEWKPFRKGEAKQSLQE